MKKYRDDHIHLKNGIQDYEIMKKYITNAIECGLDSVTFLDHGFRISPKHSEVINSLEIATKFLKNIARAREEFQNIEINSGIELDYSFDKDFRQKNLDLLSKVKFDRVLGSIHSMSYLSAKQYLQAVLKMLDEYPINVVAHIDLRKNYKNHIHLIKKIIKKCVKKNVAIEFNTSDRAVFNDKQFYFIIKLLNKYKCDYTIGSDAHKVEEVGYHIKEMTDKVRDHYQITKVYLLHAGITHPSAFIRQMKNDLNKKKKLSVIITPYPPETIPNQRSIIFFQRLKRFYDNQNIETAKTFIKKTRALKTKGYEIGFTLHNFFPIDRPMTNVDEFVTKNFLEQCEQIFLATKYMQKSLKKHFGKDSHLFKFKIQNLKPSKYKMPKVKKGTFVYTVFGNIYPYKMIQQIIQEFEKIQKDDIMLIIAGLQPKNSKVNLKVKNNKILRLDAYIDDRLQKKLNKVTNIYINCYDLNFNAFKYGFYPSSFNTLQKFHKKIITAKTEITDELIDKDYLIEFNINDKNALHDARMTPYLNRYNLKVHRHEKKNNYKSIEDIFCEKFNIE